MSAGPLRAERHTRALANAQAARHASYGQVFFRIIGSDRPDGVLAVEVDHLFERSPQGFQQLLAGPLLAVHAWHFLDPTDPPIVTYS